MGVDWWNEAASGKPVSLKGHLPKVRIQNRNRQTLNGFLDGGSEDVMTLQDLVGEHELSGVFFDSRKYQDDWMEESTVVYFQLNGKNYEAVEYPSDGYRSSLSHIDESNAEPQNTFTPVIVVAEMKTGKDDEWFDDEVLQFKTKSGKVVLEIGTSNASDYYPGFVGYFSPENLKE